MKRCDRNKAIPGLSKRLIQVLRAKEMRIPEFAASLGASRNWIYELFAGAPPSSDFLLRLNKVHGISIDWVLTGQGQMILSEGIDILSMRAILLHLHFALAAQQGDEAAAAAVERYKASGDPRSLGQQLKRFGGLIDVPTMAAVIYNDLLAVAADERLGMVLPTILNRIGNPPPSPPPSPPALTRSEIGASADQ